MNTVLKIYLVLFCFSNATQVIFIVDMSEETVGAGGLEMTDNGDGTWELTTQLNPGDYTYKFRNGFYDYWGGPGWESDNGLIEGGCAVGEYFDRQLSVGNSDLVEGSFCFGSYDELCNSDSIEYILIWNDEFDGSGAIDSEKWFYQTQLSNGNSWYNNEIQHYTDRLDNSYVSDGTLKIVAKKRDIY